MFEMKFDDLVLDFEYLGDSNKTLLHTCFPFLFIAGHQQ